MILFHWTMACLPNATDLSAFTEGGLAGATRTGLGRQITDQMPRSRRRLCGCPRRRVAALRWLRLELSIARLFRESG